MTLIGTRKNGGGLETEKLLAMFEISGRIFVAVFHVFSIVTSFVKVCLIVEECGLCKLFSFQISYGQRQKKRIGQAYWDPRECFSDTHSNGLFVSIRASSQPFNPLGSVCKR